MASHGYLVISLDFFDTTASTSTDKDGNPVHFKWPEGKMKNKDGTPNMDFHEQLRPKFDVRV